MCVCVQSRAAQYTCNLQWIPLFCERSMHSTDVLRVFCDSTNAQRVLYKFSTSAEVLYECFTSVLRMYCGCSCTLRVLYEHNESNTNITNALRIEKCSTSVLRVVFIQNVHKVQPHCEGLCGFREVPETSEDIVGVYPHRAYPYLCFPGRRKGGVESNGAYPYPSFSGRREDWERRK